MRRDYRFLYNRMSRDDVLQGNDITRLAIPLQASADFQSQLLGQCAFAIGQHSVGGAVLCHGALLGSESPDTPSCSNSISPARSLAKSAIR